MQSGDFLPQFLSYALSQNSYQRNNHDSLRYPIRGLKNKIIFGARDLLLDVADRFGFSYTKNNNNQARKDYLEFIDRNISEIDSVFRSLSDEHSRKIFIELFAYRLLGSRYVKLSRNNDDYHASVALAKGPLIRKSDDSKESKLDFFELAQIGFPIRLDAHVLTVVNTFLLKQYQYVAKDKIITVGEGDVVIDAGACWGDTALLFSHLAGKKGNIYAFEFVEANIAAMQRNIELNNSFAGNIEIVPNAVWNVSGETLTYDDSGPGTNCLGDQGQKSVKTKSIDQLVDEKNLLKLDFIKMDIEGAELKALQGAERCIRRFKPTLAISLYHQPEDIFQIPKYIESLDLGYQFYLDHFTIHSEETVLFAL